MITQIRMCQIELLIFMTVLCTVVSFLRHLGHCLTKLYIYRRAALEAALASNDPHFPTLESLRWRVDVAISTRYGQHCCFLT